jgi:hypothetical protein
MTPLLRQNSFEHSCKSTQRFVAWKQASDSAHRKNTWFEHRCSKAKSSTNGTDLEVSNLKLHPILARSETQATQLLLKFGTHQAHATSPPPTVKPAPFNLKLTSYSSSVTPGTAKAAYRSLSLMFLATMTPCTSRPLARCCRTHPM